MIYPCDYNVVHSKKPFYIFNYTLYGNISTTFSHLWSGTGYPWDSHNNTISDLALRLNIVPLESDEKAGDFIPTGSKNDWIDKTM